MDRLYYEMLINKVWKLFPFVIFEYEKHSINEHTYRTLITAAWSFKGKAYKCMENISSDAFIYVTDKDKVVMSLYQKIISAILKTIEEDSND